MIYGKILLEVTLELKTGLHIGGSSEYSAIGSVDSPVIKDPLNGLPMIPGSSLKGKLRSLLAKKYNLSIKNHQEDDPKIRRLFGGNDKEGNPRTARIIFSDSIMDQEEERRIQELGAEEVTEVKFENTINRIIGEAMPRQIERVVRGCQFKLNLFYEVFDELEAIEDLTLLKEAFDLLSYDYLGASGSRGYGRVDFTDHYLQLVVGDISEETLNTLEMTWSNG